MCFSFIAALWLRAGKGLTSWLFFMMFNCVSVTVPCGILGQMWYLIVLIPDLCCLPYLIHSEMPLHYTICSFTATLNRHKGGLFSLLRALLLDQLFDLILYVPVNNFSVMSGQVFLG